MDINLFIPTKLLLMKNCNSWEVIKRKELILWLKVQVNKNNFAHNGNNRKFLISH